jgi:peroxiredoxin family protein
MTKAEQDMSDLMNEINDKKETLKLIVEDLQSLKNQLIELMVDNNLVKVNTCEASATIMKFNRGSLIKDNVILTVDSVNEGTLEGKINMSDLIHISNIYFVLVRSKE